FIPNAGIRLQNVAIADAGTYSVHVNVNLHGSVTTEMQSVEVEVSGKRFITPSSQSLPSTLYSNGRFYLNVPNPVITGEYTCAIDHTSPGSLCVQSGSPLDRGDTVSVDSAQAQFAILEARAAATEKKHQQDVASLQQQLASMENKHQQEVTSFQQEVASLQQQMTSMENRHQQELTSMENRHQQELAAIQHQLDANVTSLASSL
ncbi:hypothetical protein BaRGS_00027299, partial [Batillaria attramentaria]